jgi:hypothetical protein
MQNSNTNSVYWWLAKTIGKLECEGSWLATFMGVVALKSFHFLLSSWSYELSVDVDGLRFSLFPYQTLGVVKLNITLMRCKSHEVHYSVSQNLSRAAGEQHQRIIEKT